VPDEPLLPYAGTSGWRGSETSKRRAEDADSSGLTSKRQAQVMALIAMMGVDGITVKELREYTRLHHGSASGLLSVLHKTGALARLSETRDRCKVYVLTEHVGGRETEPHGYRKRTSVPVTAPPPSGWYPFGIHAGWNAEDIPPEIEFSDQTGDDGLPLWERVVRR
jgi:hypothetical protein